MSGTISGAGTVKSDWTDCSACIGLSYAIGWTGGSGAAATFGVEVENDDDTKTTAVGPITLTLTSSPSAVSGVSGTTGIDIPFTGFRRARLVVTTTAGSYTLAVLAFPKRIAK